MSATGQSYGRVVDRIAGIPLSPVGWRFLSGLGFVLSIVMVLLAAILWLLIRGVGVWGIRIPVAWGFAIVNFVWWIGIGHAGTLISAILLLMRQTWRTTINRISEAMTLFAVMMAGLFPLLHLGRLWKFYYLFPYPGNLGVYPQWRSPLVWDVFAVLTYFTVSLIFWYVGLIPDLASLRDRAQRLLTRRIAGFFALGWRGAGRHWHNYRMLYLLLAGLATPLVVSVHSIVSLDFSVSMVPGWHSTIFPPYFVAGAIYSGFAMVLTILVPLRVAFKLQDMITLRHLDASAQLMLATGLIVAYGYVMEFYMAWYSFDRYERAMAMNRILGAYWPSFALMMLGNVLAPQALWWRRVRRSPLALFFLALIINLGMWEERFVIVVQSLHRDFMPSAWEVYQPTIWDFLTLGGSLGLFTFLFLMFARYVPMIAVSEVNEYSHEHHLEGAERDTPPPADERPAPAPLQSGLPAGRLYGLVAEFQRADDLLAATRRAWSAGYRKMEAYTPFPIDGLSEALGLFRNKVPYIVFTGAMLGAASFFFYAWYSTGILYQWNIGGRPPFSWPAYVPITFELGVLGGCLFGLIGMLILNRLPRLNHPIFDAPGFRRASRDRFFLCIERNDPIFDPDRTRTWLQDLGSPNVSEVRT